MIKTERIFPNILKIVAPERLRADDFRELAPEVDAIVQNEGGIRLIIDATRLRGWDDIAAFERHASFIRDHQQKVEKIAVIAPHEWQHLVVAAVRVFIHPNVRAFNPSQEAEAEQWIRS
ncbi:MAG: STAS/SEC14 domain-containing protein [Alphaproteobacteria bacterium]